MLGLIITREAMVDL